MWYEILEKTALASILGAGAVENMSECQAITREFTSHLWSYNLCCLLVKPETTFELSYLSLTLCLRHRYNTTHLFSTTFHKNFIVITITCKVIDVVALHNLWMLALASSCFVFFNERFMYRCWHVFWFVGRHSSLIAGKGLHCIVDWL